MQVVASHFNLATALDIRLFLTGAAAIAVTITVIVAVTVLSLVGLGEVCAAACGAGGMPASTACGPTSPSPWCLASPQCG